MQPPSIGYMPSGCKFCHSEDTELEDIHSLAQPRLRVFSPDDASASPKLIIKCNYVDCCLLHLAELISVLCFSELYF